VSELFPPRISRARIHLMLDHPYLASAVARLPIKLAAERDWCQTMATDGYHIFINPAFCETLTDGDLMFVLAHELLHCVLGHIDRGKDRLQGRWNESVDYATNQTLESFGLKTPKGGLLDKEFAGRTAEDIYNMISREAPSKGARRAKGRLLDTHLDPEGPHRIEAGCENLTPAERQWIRLALLDDLEKGIKSRGMHSGRFFEEIVAARSERVPWEQLLARFVSGIRKDDYRWLPPNRRHLWRGIYLPSVGRPGPEHLVVAIDTSGSMTTGVLGRVLGEIDKLRATTECRLTILQADAAVTHAGTYEPYEDIPFASFKVYGRGGTSFLPVFEWIANAEETDGLRPEALIYLTDGDGAFPKNEPDYPTIWIYIDSGAKPPPFGQLLSIC